MTGKDQFRVPLESLLTRTKLARWGDVSKSLGDVFYTLEGTRIERGQSITKRERLPAIFDSSKIVAGDLIPGTSWGSSLSNMLTATSWDKLRTPLIQKNNNVCEVCGTRHSSLDVHEIWSYAMPTKAEIQEAQRSDCISFGVQKLDGLMAICKDCHKMFHLGLANVNNELDAVLSRLRAVNRWSQQQVNRYYNLVGDRYEDASKVYWGLDFSNIKHPDGGLTLKSSWNVCEQEPNLIECEGRFGQQLTAIICTPWKHHKEKQWRKALTLQEFNKS